MILILDNLINNYLNILSCLIILSIFNLNRYNFFLIVIVDVLLNQVPVISILVFLLYLLNKIIFKKIINNNFNKFIFSIVYMFIFISFLYCINDYNFSFSYYIKANILSIFFNILIYYIYIFYN